MEQIKRKKYPPPPPPKKKRIKDVLGQPLTKKCFDQPLDDFVDGNTTLLSRSPIISSMRRISLQTEVEYTQLCQQQVSLSLSHTHTTHNYSSAPSPFRLLSTTHVASSGLCSVLQAILIVNKTTLKSSTICPRHSWVAYLRSFSASSHTSTICRMLWLAHRSSEPTLTCT